MIHLALDFSSPERSAALLCTSAHEPPVVLGALSDQRSTSARALVLIRDLLARAGVAREAIEGLLIGLGPGSYTGIRSSIAIAQGWQLARGTPVRGVSTVECLALQAQAQGWFGEITIAIDAQRHEVYLATYRLSPSARELLQPLRLATLEELRLHLAHSGSILVGPEAQRWSPSARILFPRAEAMGAWVEVPPTQGEQLEPIYLRETSFVKVNQK